MVEASIRGIGSYKGRNVINVIMDEDEDESFDNDE